MPEHNGCNGFEHASVLVLCKSNELMIKVAESS